MDRLRHGYTNRSRRLADGHVEKEYDGSDARERSERELLCLTALAGRLPVPEVIRRDASKPAVTLRAMSGTPGQDLMAAGQAAVVLELLGALLAQLQQIDASDVVGLVGRGSVIVHGDYGPQNVLIEDHRISALLDWEFAHLGQPVEDLAWAEWVVRMHHEESQDAIPNLFRAAQLHPAWAARHAVMVERCVELLRRTEREGPPSAADLWRARLARTESWIE